VTVHSSTPLVGRREAPRAFDQALNTMTSRSKRFSLRWACEVVTNLKMAVGMLICVPAAGFLVGCTSTQDRATAIATELVRKDADRIQTQVAGLFRSTESKENIYRRALQNLPPKDRTGSAALLNSLLTEGEARFDITTVHMADAGGGLDKAQATVRLCARIIARFNTRPSSVEISNLECPASLPNHVAGSGDISKIVSYRK
jgi:hypothetical protein